MKRLDHLYDAKGRIGDPCAYCGVYSDTFDHVPPLRHAEMLSDADLDLRFLRKFPSCNECNSHLGAKLFLTLRERRASVAKFLARKYRKFLNMPKWDEDELEELNPRFAEDIRARSKFAEHQKLRLAWARGSIRRERREPEEPSASQRAVLGALR